MTTSRSQKRRTSLLIAGGAVLAASGAVLGCGSGVGGKIGSRAPSAGHSGVGGQATEGATLRPLAAASRTSTSTSNKLKALEAAAPSVQAHPASGEGEANSVEVPLPPPIVVAGASCPVSVRSPYRQPFGNPSRNSLADARYCRGELTLVEVPLDSLGGGSADWLYTTHEPSQIVVASQGRALRVEVSEKGVDYHGEDTGPGGFPVVLKDGELVGASGQIRGFVLDERSALALTEEAGVGSLAGTEWVALRKIPFTQLSSQYFQHGAASPSRGRGPVREGFEEEADRQKPSIAHWQLNKSNSEERRFNYGASWELNKSNSAERIFDYRDDSGAITGKASPGKLVSSSPFLANRDVVVNHGDLLRWMRPTGEDVAVLPGAVIPGSAVMDEQNQVVAFAEIGESYDLLWVNLRTRKTVRTRLPYAGGPVQPPVILPGRVVVVFEDRVVSFSGRTKNWTASIDPRNQNPLPTESGDGLRGTLAGPSAGDWDFPQNLTPMATATRDGRLVVRFKNYLSVISPTGQLERAIAFPSAITSNPVVLFNGGICAASFSVLKCAIPREMVCPPGGCPPCPPRVRCAPCRLPRGCQENLTNFWREN